MANEDFFDRLKLDRPVRVELVAGRQPIADLQVFYFLVPGFTDQRRAGAEAGLVEGSGDGADESAERAAGERGERLAEAVLAAGAAY